MSTMTPSLWAQATEIQLQKRALRAQAKKRPLKVRSPRELSWYLSHGWKILSHQQHSYGASQHWLLIPE